MNVFPTNRIPKGVSSQLEFSLPSTQPIRQEQPHICIYMTTLNDADLPKLGRSLIINRTPAAMDGRHPPGYRFYPTEEELISFYLQNKLQGRRPEMHRVIPVVGIYDIEPWHLPGTLIR